MADSRGITDLPLDIFTAVMPSVGVPDAQLTVCMGKLSSSCRTLHRLFKPELTRRATRQLWQAMIDDDRETIAKITKARPDLLLAPMPAGFVIKSKYTHQQFDLAGETILAAAAKRKQIKMIELLLPYYNKLEQTEDVIKAKRDALSAWKAYEIQKNAEGEDEIIIPKEYADYAQSLIDVFKDEIFPNGVPGVNNVPLNVVLSERTEGALESLLNILVPKTAVKLDEHIDEELLLLAIFKAYVINFPTFNHNWDKLDALCIRLMGLTQSALTPESAKIWCEGLDGVVTAIQKGKEKEISAQAALHKLIGGEDFYRASRGSRIGAGFEFLCGIFGRDGRAWSSTRAACRVAECVLEKLCQAKTTNFWKCYAAIAAPTKPSPNR